MKAAGELRIMVTVELVWLRERKRARGKRIFLDTEMPPMV
jgi:hypothetical protein